MLTCCFCSICCVQSDALLPFFITLNYKPSDRCLRNNVNTHVAHRRQAGLQTLTLYFSHFPQQPPGVGTYLPILQMRRSRQKQKYATGPKQVFPRANEPTRQNRFPRRCPPLPHARGAKTHRLSFPARDQSSLPSTALQVLADPLSPAPSPQRRSTGCC